MSLKKRIVVQLTERIKAKDGVGKSTLRLLLAAVKNREIETGNELDDQETLRVIARQANQRREAGAIEEIAAKGMKDMGRVMKAVMAKLAGSADGKLVNEIVKKQLSG